VGATNHIEYVILMNVAEVVCFVWAVPISVEYLFVFLGVCHCNLHLYHDNCQIGAVTTASGFNTINRTSR